VRNVTLRRIRANIAAVEKQYVLHIQRERECVCGVCVCVCVCVCVSIHKSLLEDELRDSKHLEDIKIKN
jgi:hypothetical protein